MKVADMHSKPDGELNRHTEKLRQKLIELRSEIGVKEVRNIRELRQLKRELAATLTIAGEKTGEEEK